MLCEQEWKIQEGGNIWELKSIRLNIYYHTHLDGLFRKSFWTFTIHGKNSWPSLENYRKEGKFMIAQGNWMNNDRADERRSVFIAFHSPQILGNSFCQLSMLAKVRFIEKWKLWRARLAYGFKLFAIKIFIDEAIFAFSFPFFLLKLKHPLHIFNWFATNCIPNVSRKNSFPLGLMPAASINIKRSHFRSNRKQILKNFLLKTNNLILNST